MLWFFLLALAVIALVRVQYPKYIQLIGSNFTSYRIARQTFAQSEYQSRPEWIVSFIVTIVSISLFGYLNIISQSSDSSGGIVFYLKILLATGLIFVLKIMAGLLVESLSKKLESIRIYLGNTFLISFLASAVLLPISLAMALDNSGNIAVLGWIGLGVLGAAFLLRLARGVSHAISERIPLYYIILYLCTLEILPLGVLIKVILISYT